MARSDTFVLGLDLDGTCADYYGRMREIAAEWTGRKIEDLPEITDPNFATWGLSRDEYPELHRFAVTQRQLFETMNPLIGAPQALRRLSSRGVRIRIITHRLIIGHTHETAVSQTVRWLDRHGFPYWDLCFMGEKGDVGANLYVEDMLGNITALLEAGKEVIIMDNANNIGIDNIQAPRAENWIEAERLINDSYDRWLTQRM
ncbi:MAG: 5'-nucleotidase [Actinobacteria bacterium]|nr:5'-nucleotidase [Actinomycetota bacterium]